MDNINKVIWLLCINDFHSEMEESEGFPGCVKFVTAVKDFKHAHPNSIVLFGGDNYKGNPIVEYLHGEPVTEMMKMLDTKASAIGNHDFDFGVDIIYRWQKQGAFKFLAANLIDKRTNRCPDSISASMTLDINGIKILIIGLSTVEPLATDDRPSEMENFEIIDGSTVVRDIVGRFNTKPNEKPDAVIALSHFPLQHIHGTDNLSGDEAINLCTNVPELDGLITGHLHQFMALSINSVAVAQGSSNSRGFAWLRLEFNGDNNLMSVKPGFEDIRSTQAKIKPDTEMHKIHAQSKNASMEKLSRILTYIPEPVIHRNKDFEVDPEGTPLSELATKVMCDLGSCQIALFYSGRIGNGLPPGDITLYQAYQTLFFSNGIVAMKLTGREILKNIEIGIRSLKKEGASPIAIRGVRVLADYAKPYLHRVESIVLDSGKQFDLDCLYSVAVDDFLAENSMGFDFSKAVEASYTGLSIREGMINSLDGGYRLDKSRRKFLRLLNKEC